MKKYFKLLMVALFATLSFSLVSCGDDDDDDNSALVGTWEYIDSGNDEDYDYGARYWVESVTFTEDGRFSISETEVSNGSVVYDEMLAYGTYSVSGKLKDGAELTLIGTDTEDGTTSTEVCLAKVKGDKLELTEDGDKIVFTRK